VRAAAWASATVAASGSPPQTQPAPAGPPSWAASAVPAPVRITRATPGTAGYRVAGSGPPLVLITGYGGTMQTRDPRLADTPGPALRVVTFDNAGTGRTQARPVPLTIDALAGQASALIGTPGPARPDVPGWSMGGMIAPARAVRHPAPVRRPVLCATFPRTGTGAALPGSDTGAHQRQRAGSGGCALSRQPGYGVWRVHRGDLELPGRPAAPGRHDRGPGARRNPVAGPQRPGRPPDRRDLRAHPDRRRHRGRLGPAAPDHSLARPIRGARLVPCPDAGHAFMVQEGTPFPVLIQTFPTRAPRPVSMPVMRARFLAGQAPVRPAARARDPELQALPADPAAGRPPSSASPSPAPSPPSTASS